MEDNLPVRSYAENNRQLARSFEAYLIACNRSPATIRSYRDSVGRFIDVLGSKSFAEADRSDIRELQSDLLAKGLADASLELHTAAIRSFYKFLRLGNVVKRDPTLLLSHRKQPKRLPRALSVAEIEALIQACKKLVERALIETFYATGMRISEICSMRLEEVDLAGRAMMVRNGKGGKDRAVLFGAHAAKAIRKYLGGRREGFLFQGRTGRRYNERSVRATVAMVGRRAGIEDVHPHALRRAFATHCLRGGMNIRALQALLGHSNISTTQLYTTLSVGDLKGIHDRCHPTAKECLQ